MNKGMLALVSGAALLAGMGAASAEGPVQLSGDQLDNVTASGPFSFTFTKQVFASNFEEVFAVVFLDGSIVQATADVQAQVVQLGTADDIKVDAATFVEVSQAPGTVGILPATFSQVQANSLSFIAWE